MKAYRVTALVIDFEGTNKEELQALIEMTRHVDPSVIKMEEAEIGEWDDSNPLNHGDTRDAEIKRLFDQTCTWKECFDPDYWETSCGQEFILLEGTPADNNMKFCTYCGKEIAKPTIIS